jgi:hypothetical protein
MTALVACAALGLTACDSFRRVERRSIAPDVLRSMGADEKQELREASPFLKAHMRNGDLFVLQEWLAGGDGVSGSGTRYDPSRNPVETGQFHLAVDSVAVFETNVTKTSPALAAITILAVATAAVAIMCAINPKSCFGSCPTFYVAGHDRPLAEGFSSSIAPSLEATDVDQLDVGVVGAGRFEVVMKNEAYETHVVRHVDVLALPHCADERVLRDVDGSFWAVANVTPPSFATADEGECVDALRATDGLERFSLADSTNLAAKETIEIAFEYPRAGRCGIAVACRQSLLSTYLLYQTFAYMGQEAGHWIAELERGDLGDAGSALVEMLGGIVLSIETAPGVWVEVGEIREFGPIAVDQHLLAFDAPVDWTGHARLRMTRGAWRVDAVRLGTLVGRVEPIRVPPTRVLKGDRADELALALLTDRTRSLTTLPGDHYTLIYELPDRSAHYEVFLESRGYYIEWMREDWLREENPVHLAQLFFDPASALARLAPEYKKVEAGMEETFWGSRYAKP